MGLPTVQLETRPSIGPDAASGLLKVIGTKGHSFVMSPSAELRTTLSNRDFLFRVEA